MASLDHSVGKVVTEFLYAPKERKAGTEIRVPVRLVQLIDRPEKLHNAENLTGSNGRRKKFIMPGNTRSATFRVVMDKPPINIECQDIEVLRRLVFDKLDKDYALPWEKYLLVEVEAVSQYGGESGEGLEVTYQKVDIATLEDGTKVHRFRDAYYKRDKVFDGLPHTGKQNGRGDSVSLVKASPANVKAIEEFCKRIKAVREMIGEFLGPDNIEQNLPTWSRLLPAPPEASKPKTVKSRVVGE